MKFTVTGVHTTCLALLVLALSACGGGEQVDQFQPARVLAFGDEASVIDSSRRKYTVNAVPDPANPDPAAAAAAACKSNRIWAQVLANGYGLLFQECVGAVLPMEKRIWAEPEAKAADLVTQIDNFIVASGFSTKDLVTVLIGTHDIKEIYETGGSDADAKAAGALVARQVNRIADAGAKVIVSTLPELGVTPYGIGKGADADLLNNLTASFNLELLRNLTNDGRKIGLVEADRMVRNILNAPASNGYVNWTQAACVVPLPGCTDAAGDLDVDKTTTANAGQPASATTWLWASELQLSVSGHANLGNLAGTRARNNPF